MACWRLRFQAGAYGLRKLGLIAKIGQGLLFGFAFVGVLQESEVGDTVGKTGPARFQLTPEENVRTAVSILPGPGTVVTPLFRKAPVGVVFNPVVTGLVPCWEMNTLKPSST